MWGNLVRVGSVIAFGCRSITGVPIGTGRVITSLRCYLDESLEALCVALDWRLDFGFGYKAGFLIVLTTYRLRKDLRCLPGLCPLWEIETYTFNQVGYP